MTEWQWKVVMALVRYVLNQTGNHWVEYRVEDSNILHDALSREP